MIVNGAEIPLNRIFFCLFEKDISILILGSWIFQYFFFMCKSSFLKFILKCSFCVLFVEPDVKKKIERIKKKYTHMEIELKDME